MKTTQLTPKARVKTGGSMWLQKTPRLLAALIIFLSATQLGYHFWPESSLVYGIRVDYLAPTIYLLDLLIIFYLILLRPRLAALSRLLPLVLISLLFSANPIATLFWSAHLALYLGFVLSLNLRDKLVGWSLLGAALFQVVLAGLQVIKGSFVGGALYYLGERTLALGSPGIARGEFMGKEVLRAYATFGHPNVLAGWLTIALLIVILLKARSKILWPLAILAAAGVLLAQSRSGMLALFGLVIPLFLIKTIKLRLLYCSIALLLLVPLSPSLLSPARAERSLTERLEIQALSFKALNNYPVFGTGAQASISSYPALSTNHRLVQPDHNSFTLFLSWFGVFGVLALLYSSRSFLVPLLPLLLPLLPLLLLDHYLLTSPQGLFILILYLRVSMNYAR